MNFKPDLSSAKLVELAPDEAQLFIQLVMSDARSTDDERRTMLHKMLEDPGAGSVALRILHGRLDLVGSAGHVCPTLMIWAAFLCRSPGDAVMWAYTLTRLADRLGCSEAKKLTLLRVTDMDGEFAMGFPDRESYQKIWEAQKVPGCPGNNWLDLNQWRDTQNTIT